MAYHCRIVLHEGPWLASSAGLVGSTIRSLSFNAVVDALCGLICRAVAPVADLNEKAFITYTGKVAPRNANFGQIFSSDLPFLPRKCHRAPEA